MNSKEIEQRKLKGIIEGQKSLKAWSQGQYDRQLYRRLQAADAIPNVLQERLSTEELAAMLGFIQQLTLAQIKGYQRNNMDAQEIPVGLIIMQAMSYGFDLGHDYVTMFGPIVPPPEDGTNA